MVLPSWAMVLPTGYLLEEPNTARCDNPATARGNPAFDAAASGSGVGRNSEGSIGIAWRAECSCRSKVYLLSRADRRPEHGISANLIGAGATVDMARRRGAITGRLTRVASAMATG